MAGINSNRNWPHGSHGLHQGVLLAAGNVNEPGVVSSIVFGVVVTRLVILKDYFGN